MILRGADVKYVRAVYGDEEAIYVNGVLRVSGTSIDVVNYLLHSFDISYQKITLSDSVLDTFDGVLPQQFAELDEVLEDEANCNL